MVVRAQGGGQRGAMAAGRQDGRIMRLSGHGLHDYFCRSFWTCDGVERGQVRPITQPAFKTRTIAL